MRRLLVALVPALLFCACGGEEAKPPVTPAPVAPPPPPPPRMTAEPAPAPQASLADMEKADLGTALEGLNSHDAKKFASVYADDAVISVAGLNEVVGRDAIAANMAEWFETFKEVKLGFSRVWAKGDTMVLEWVINGKHHGELFGVKGTEQPIGHYGLSIVTFRPDGKVQRENRYGDLGTVMTQIGGSKKPRPIPAVPAAPETFESKGDDDKNVEIAKKALASLESKKDTDFTSLLADDIEHDGLFHLETSKGKAEAQKFFKSFTTAFPDAKFETSRVLSVGDYVIAESVLKATHKGQLGTIPPTKKPIAIHLADVFEIKDGKIKRAWTYQNSLEMQQQLGLFGIASAGNVPASQAGPAKPASGAAGAAGAGGGTGGGGGKGTGGGGGKDTGGGGGKGTGGGGGQGTGGGKK